MSVVSWSNVNVVSWSNVNAVSWSNMNVVGWSHVNVEKLFLVFLQNTFNWKLSTCSANTEICCGYPQGIWKEGDSLLLVSMVKGFS